MISAADKKYLRETWKETSDTVREWIQERMESASKGNPWAEEQLKVFIRYHKETLSGVIAHRRLVGEYEQTKLL